jgi:hypothetical protein
MASKEVLLLRDIAVKESFPSEFITQKVTLDIHLLNNYIADNQPDENPGWTKSRVSLYIRFCEIDAGATEVIVEAFFERYGTRSALMLIPPTWVPVPSNGFFEEEILVSIEKQLTPQQGEAQ